MSSVKARAARAYIALRRLSSRFRVLPNVIIAGAQKSGTTSLAAFLAQHPEAKSSLFKEVHYFDNGVHVSCNNYEKGEMWYRAHFPIRVRSAPRSAVFEATPMYLFHPLAAARIQGLLPSAKIIIILRNPTDRAISHYRHSKHRGHESLPMLDALKAEKERIGATIDESTFKNNDVRYFSYKARGLYAEQIIRYQALFPSENILIVSSDDLFNSTHATLGDIFSFLGLRQDIRMQDIRPRNVSGTSGGVSQEVLDYLNDHFREPNQALYSLIGRDFEW